MPEGKVFQRSRREKERERGRRVSFFFGENEGDEEKKVAAVASKREKFLPLSLFCLSLSLSLSPSPSISQILTLCSGAGEHQGDSERRKEEAGGSHCCLRRRRRLSGKKMRGFLKGGCVSERASSFFRASPLPLVVFGHLVVTIELVPTGCDASLCLLPQRVLRQCFFESTCPKNKDLGWTERCSREATEIAPALVSQCQSKKRATPFSSFLLAVLPNRL